MTTLVNKLKPSLWMKVALGLAILFTMALAACTDQRQKGPLLRQSDTLGGYSGGFQEVADVTYKGAQTSVVSMTVQGTSLYLTGYPFGFSRWDIGSDPENPQLLGAAADQIDVFSPDPPFGGWTVNYFGTGGLAALNGLVYSSGMAGLSIINVSQSAFPTEVNRYPRPDAQGNQGQNASYIYQAIVTDPNGQPLIYGFGKSDQAYTLSISGTNAQPISTLPYSNNGSTCCVGGAAAFGGRIFVAMRSFLWALSSTGQGLQSVGTISSLNPVNVVSTSQYLYVHHRPTAGGGSGLQAGIYVFNMSGQNVTFIPIDPLTFAVSADDSHLYANLDDMAVKIYRLR